jgi:hypothetical protein
MYPLKARLFFTLDFIFTFPASSNGPLNDTFPTVGIGYHKNSRCNFVIPLHTGTTLSDTIGVTRHVPQFPLLPR